MICAKLLSWCENNNWKGNAENCQLELRRWEKYLEVVICARHCNYLRNWSSLPDVSDVAVVSRVSWRQSPRVSLTGRAREHVDMSGHRACLVSACSADWRRSSRLVILNIKTMLRGCVPAINNGIPSQCVWPVDSGLVSQTIRETITPTRCL